MENEIVKKSLEKSKNVLEEKRKNVKQKICIKKDTHVYNNCYELRSRAINNTYAHKHTHTQHTHTHHIDTLTHMFTRLARKFIQE